MLRTQHFMGKKTFFLATYLLLLSFGLLSFWSTIADFRGLDYAVFLPLTYSVLTVVILTFLSFQSGRLVYQLVVYLISLFLISTIAFPIFQLMWTSDMISAFVYLLSLGSILGLMILHRKEKIVTTYMLSISYSCLFLLVLLITQAVPLMYRNMLIMLIIGQAVTLLLSYLYRLQFQDKAEEHEQICEVTLTVATWKMGLLYILFVLFGGLYWDHIYPYFTLWVLVFIFSLFLLAALLNSLYQSLIMHSIFSLIVVPLSLVKQFIFPFDAQELLLTSFLIFTLGAHLFIFMIKHNTGRLSAYLQLVIIFLAGLFPLVHGESNLHRIALLFISAYSIMQVICLLLIPERPRRRRLKGRESSLNQTVSSELLTEDVISKEKDEVRKLLPNQAKRGLEASAAEREKELTLQYREWLVKKGETLGVSFLRKND